LAEAGLVGLMVDGPHAGSRNPTGADEQFLMFSLSNPLATRDNVRQTALELALLPDWLPELEAALPLADCPGAGAGGLSSQALALIGHSMGATVAPLVVAVEPRYRAVVLSGAGAGYPANLVYKQSPLPTRPIAEALLQAPPGSLTPFDPFLQLLQAAAEPADPPPYLRASLAQDPPHALVFQGIVDTYILPPMANPVALAWGLDLAGPAEDDGHPELAAFRPLLEELPLVGAQAIPLPARGNRGGRTAVVRQLVEDGVEDGHEVFFQRPEGPEALRAFLEPWSLDQAPVVP
jgi:pimeloyl-ACP methyl ester carboxylesterase